MNTHFWPRAFEILLWPYGLRDPSLINKNVFHTYMASEPLRFFSDLRVFEISVIFFSGLMVFEIPLKPALAARAYSFRASALGLSLSEGNPITCLRQGFRPWTLSLSEGSTLVSCLS